MKLKLQNPLDENIVVGELNVMSWSALPLSSPRRTLRLIRCTTLSKEDYETDTLHQALKRGFWDWYVARRSQKRTLRLIRCTKLSQEHIAFEQSLNTQCRTTAPTLVASAHTAYPRLAPSLTGGRCHSMSQIVPPDLWKFKYSWKSRLDYWWFFFCGKSPRLVVILKGF